MEDYLGSLPKHSVTPLDDENSREFFRNHELWLKSRGWLYVFEKALEESATVASPGGESTSSKGKGVLNVEKKELFEKHDASARYFTSQLLNSFDRELFDGFACSKTAWATVKNEYKRVRPKEVQKLER